MSGPDLIADDFVALSRLVTEIVWRIDHGRADTVHELFVPDGVLILGADSYRGRDALIRWGEARSAVDRVTRHVCTNLRLASAGPGRAHGTVVVSVFLHDGPGVGRARPLLVGEYTDEYARVAGEWRFVSRRMDPIFTSFDG